MSSSWLRIISADQALPPSSPLQVVQSIASTRISHGGTSRSVPALCDALAELGCNVHLVTGVSDEESDGAIFPSEKIHSHLCRYSGRFGRVLLGRSFAQVIGSLGAGCLIHDHGLWLATNHAVARISRERNLVRVVSPRGMAGTWAMNHGRWKKSMAWSLYQRRDLQSATAFHATSEQEAEEIRLLGLTQPIAVIANGVTSPALPARTRFDKKTRVLFMSRLHPKKGLLNLLDAWSRAKMPPSWELVLAGPDEGGYQREVERQVDRLELTDSVQFTGPISDSDKWQLYVDADYFVLPSFNENYGIVIAEALSAGLPVITTTGTPWSDVVQYQCGWWVAPEVSGLQSALRDASQQSIADRHVMSTRARAYMSSKYSWQKIAGQMLSFYQYIRQQGACPVPDFVLAD